MNIMAAEPCIERERVRIGDITFHVALAGEGEPLLLLHGWPQTWYAWRHVISLLAPHYRVIAPDLPGFGDSTKPASGYDKKTVSAYLHALVRALGHESVRVVGHDLGGQVAYAYSAQFRAHTSHLAMIEAGVMGLGKEDAANPFKGGSWHFGFNMVPDLPEALVQGREREYLRFLFFRDRIGLVKADAITEADLDVYASAFSQPGGLRGSFNHYRALPQDFIDNRAWASEKLQMPVHVIGAAQGIALSWLDTVQAAAANVSSTLIERCGHYVPEEQPHALTDVLLAFLR